MKIRVSIILVLIQLFLIFSAFQSVGYAAQNDGNDLTSSIWTKVVLEVPGSPVTLIWKMVGADITPSGDQVISGYFYADPDDFAYGSRLQPRGVRQDLHRRQRMVPTSPSTTSPSTP